MPTLHYIAYISSCKATLSEDQLQALLRGARTFNQQVDVTGALLHNGAAFMQYFEGRPEDCVAVMERIRNSDLHHSIIPLASGMLPERQFPSWTMGCARANEASMLRLSNAEWQAQGIDSATAAAPEALQLLKAFWSAATDHF